MPPCPPELWEHLCRDTQSAMVRESEAMLTLSGLGPHRTMIATSMWILWQQQQACELRTMGSPLPAAHR